MNDDTDLGEDVVLLEDIRQTAQLSRD